MIYIGSDHAGFLAKKAILDHLQQRFEVQDLGTDSPEKIVDYPDIALKAANFIKEDDKNLGILICGTGTGMCMAANKIKGIRAANAWDEYSAQKSREHNNANILCLSGRDVSLENNLKVVDKWLNTDFSQEERHIRRINKIKKIEDSNL